MSSLNANGEAFGVVVGPTGDLTWGSWFRVKLWEGLEYQALLFARPGTGEGNLLCEANISLERLRAYFWDGQNNDDSEQSEIFPDESPTFWVYVALSIAGTIGKIRILRSTEGTFFSATFDLSAWGAGARQLWAWNDPYSEQAGDIDGRCPRIFASELTDEQLLAEARSPTPVLTPWAAYTFNAVSGWGQDTTDNDRHLTTTGTPVLEDDEPAEFESGSEPDDTLLSIVSIGPGPVSAIDVTSTVTVEVESVGPAPITNIADGTMVSLTIASIGPAPVSVITGTAAIVIGPSSVNAVFDGSSLMRAYKTIGVYSPYNLGGANGLASVIPSITTTTDLSIEGRPISDMIAAVPGSVVPLFDPDAVNIYIGWEGYQQLWGTGPDIPNGTPPAEAVEMMIELAGLVRAAGFFFVGCTTHWVDYEWEEIGTGTPYGGFTEYDSHMRQAYADGHFDFLIDFDLLELEPEDYFDETHLEDSGNIKARDFAAAGLTPWLATLVSANLAIISVGPAPVSAVVVTPITIAAITSTGPAPTSALQIVPLVTVQIASVGPAPITSIANGNVTNLAIISIGPTPSSAVAATPIATVQIASVGPSPVTSIADGSMTGLAIASVGPGPSSSIEVVLIVGVAIASVGPTPRTSIADGEVRQLAIASIGPSPVSAVLIVPLLRLAIASVGPSPVTSIARGYRHMLADPTWTFDAPSSASPLMRRKTKDPDSVIVLTYRHRMTVGERIVDSEWLVAGPDQALQVLMGLNFPTFDETSASCMLKSGTLRAQYTVTNRITTTAGRIEDRTVIITIKQL